MRDLVIIIYISFSVYMEKVIKRSPLGGSMRELHRSYCHERFGNNIYISFSSKLHSIYFHERFGYYIYISFSVHNMYMEKVIKCSP
jgi:hypothetical protein